MNNSRKKRPTFDVYIGNLPKNVNEKHLSQKFIAYGETQKILFGTDSSNNFKFAIVKYLCEPDAQKATQECNGQEWEGCTLLVRKNKYDPRQNKRLNQQDCSDGNNKQNNVAVDANYLSRRPPKKPHQVAHNASNKNKPQSQPCMIEVLCTSVENAVTFYGNPISKLNDVKNVISNLQHLCPTLNRFNSVPEDREIYAALYSEDQTWYRCIILKASIDSKPGMCTVNYIDYGNTENIGYDCIVKLPNSMKSIPPLAVKCVLSNLVECEKNKTEAAAYSRDLLLNQNVSVWTYSSIDSPTYPVTQCICNGKDVFAQVVIRGYAKAISELQNQPPPLLLQNPPPPVLQNMPQNQPVDNFVRSKFQNYTGPPNTAEQIDNYNRPKFQNFRYPVNVAEGFNTENSSQFVHGNRFMRPLAPNSNYNHYGRHTFGTERFGSYHNQKSAHPPVQVFGNDTKMRSNVCFESKINDKHGFSTVQGGPQVQVFGNIKMQSNVGFEGKMNDKHSFSSKKIQILQRSSCSEATTDKDKEYLQLCKEKESLNKELLEQYAHVNDLRLELETLQNDMNKSCMNRKIDNILSSLKLVNHIRDLVSSSTVSNTIELTCNLLKSEQNSLNISKTYRDEAESVSILFSGSLQQIKECKDMLNLTDLVKEKNKNHENLCTCLKEYLDHYRETLIDTKDIVQNIVEELNISANTFRDITLGKVPSSLDELISSYKETLEKKQEIMRKAKQNTDEKHSTFMAVFSGLQKEFSLQKSSNETDLQEEKEPASNAVNENTKLTWSEKFDNALSELNEVLTKEIETYALNNEGKSDTSIVQLLLAEIDALKNKVDESFILYEKYSSLYKRLSSLSTIDVTLPELCNIKSKVKSVKSKLRHKLADKKDIEENDEDSTEAMIELDAEINALQYQLHSLFLEEDDLKKTVALAFESNYPELNLQHPKLNLSKYSQYHYFVKQSWEPEHFMLKKISTRIGVAYESKFLNKPVIIKEFVFDCEDKVDDFVNAVKQWDGVKSDFLVKIRALFIKNERIMYALFPSASKSLVNNETVFTDSQSRLILHQVLKGLNDLHSSGLVHGALYPQAVLCDDDNILLDFCFDTKIKDGLSELKNISFKAPDHVRTSSSDMYNFGCLVLWVLFPNLPVYFTEVGSPSTDEFKLLLEEKLSVKDRFMLGSLLDSNPECRPTTEQLLKQNFLKNSFVSEHYSMEKIILPALPNNSASISSTENKDLVSISTPIEIQNEPRSSSPISTSSQEEDTACDTLDCLSALREAVGEISPNVEQAQSPKVPSDEVVSPIIEMMIEASVTNANCASSHDLCTGSNETPESRATFPNDVPSHEESTECDTFSSISALRESLNGTIIKLEEVPSSEILSKEVESLNEAVITLEDISSSEVLSKEVESLNGTVIKLEDISSSEVLSKEVESLNGTVIKLEDIPNSEVLSKEVDPQEVETGVDASITSNICTHVPSEEIGLQFLDADTAKTNDISSPEKDDVLDILCAMGKPPKGTDLNLIDASSTKPSIEDFNGSDKSDAELMMEVINGRNIGPDNVFSKLFDDVVVTDEELHMLDYVPNDNAESTKDELSEMVSKESVIP